MKVLICDSQDSPTHRKAVNALTTRLQMDGFNAVTYLHSTVQTLARESWIEMELRQDSHFAIVCAGHSTNLIHAPGHQLSFSNEMAAVPGKLIMIVVDACDLSHLPKFLLNLYHFPIDTESGYLKLTEFLRYRFEERNPKRGVWRGSGEAVPILRPEQPLARSEDRAITVIAQRLDGSRALRFQEGQGYRLHFSVGPPSNENLASGDTAIRDVPSGGLRTQWCLTSSAVELIKDYSSALIGKVGNTWTAKFDLIIPERGTSFQHHVAFIMGKLPGKLEVTIFALAANGAKEVYRNFHVDLATQASIHQDSVAKAPLHTHLICEHMWTQPPEHVQITVHHDVAFVTTKQKLLNDYDFTAEFNASNVDLSGPITILRENLEGFRQAHDDYLNDISSSDLAQRLFDLKTQRTAATEDWQKSPNDVDPRHQDTFQLVQKSDEWKNLASAGYDLFTSCFPRNSKLRALITGLLPGSRIDFQWTKGSSGWVSHVPWALMYMEPVQRNAPADPEKFLGLRFRICSRAWPTNNGSVVLGDPDKTSCLHLLYWGDKPDDEVATESAWQAEEFKKWKHSKLCPNFTQPNRKAQLLDAVDSPDVGVLYFYCHCSVDDGSRVCLRFGSTSKAEDTVRATDISQGEIASAPLIFANACTTAHADPHMTNLLEQRFFERGVRAFIGTETKVPIRLASKFGWLYLQLFYRKVDPNPLPAGEALSQARMFLWNQFRNIGGLFYGITNQYDLVLATEDEVRARRRFA